MDTTKLLISCHIIHVYIICTIHSLHRKSCMHIVSTCTCETWLTRDSMLGSAAIMVDRAFIALFLTCTAGSLDTRRSWTCKNMQAANLYIINCTLNSETAPFTGLGISIVIDCTVQSQGRGGRARSLGHIQIRVN